MMLQYLESVALIGALQVGVVATLGVAVTQYWLRKTRNATSTAPSLVSTSSLCGATLAIAFVITVAAPLPIEKWLPDLSWESEAGPMSRHAEDVADQIPQPQLSGNTSLSEPSYFFVPISVIRDNLERVIRATPSSRRPSLLISIVFYLCALLIIVGVTRLIIAISSAVILRRSAMPLVDDRITNALTRLERDGSTISERIRFAQSDRVDCGAVVGWIRPVVLLPACWRMWTEEQLRCVIAHELVHVTRGDYAWRLIGCLATSLHVFNPLMHLLYRRMVLAQELMADQIAASVVGRDRYLCALSQLALQRDGSRDTLYTAGVTPVFYGFLIRRIKMLKSQSVDVQLPQTNWRVRFAVFSLAVAGVLTLSTRGLFRPDQANLFADEPVARIAALDSRNPSSPDTTAGMFQRTKLDLQTVPSNDTGYVRLRLDELMERLGFHSMGLTGLMETQIAEGIDTFLAGKTPPDVDFGNLEQFHGNLNVGIREIESPTEDGHRHAIQLGFGMTALRLKEARDWGHWLSENVEGTKRFERDGKQVFVLPPIPTLGPAPLTLAQTDPKTIAMAPFWSRELPNVDASVDSMFDHLQRPAEPNDSKWAGAFRRMDGGLLTITMTSSQISDPAFGYEFADESEELSDYERQVGVAIQGIFKHFETLSFGVDVSDDGSRVGMRFRISAAEPSEVREKLVHAQTLVQLIRQEFDKAVAENADETQSPADSVTIELLRQVIDRTKLKLIENPNDNWEVYASTSMDKEALGGLIVAAVMGNMMAPEEEAD